MSRISTKVVALGILAVALLLAGVVSYYASSSPDGLQKVAGEQGFSDTADDHAADDSPFAGYDAGFLDDGRASVGVAGVVGVLVVAGLGSGVTYLVRRRTPESADVGD